MIDFSRSIAARWDTCFAALHGAVLTGEAWGRLSPGGDVHTEMGLIRQQGALSCSVSIQTDKGILFIKIFKPLSFIAWYVCSN